MSTLFFLHNIAIDSSIVIQHSYDWTGDAEDGLYNGMWQDVLCFILWRSVHQNTLLWCKTLKGLLSVCQNIFWLWKTSIMISWRCKTSIMINWTNSSNFRCSSKRTQLQQKYDNISLHVKRLLIVWHMTLCCLRTLVLYAFDRKYNICVILCRENMFSCTDLHTIKQSMSYHMPIWSPDSASPVQSYESCITMLEATEISYNFFIVDIELILF